MADVKVRVGADASEFSRVMKGVRGEISGIKNVIGGLVGAAATVYGLTKAFQGLGSVLQSTSQSAAAMETLRVSFETLTGSTEIAADMMKTFREEAAKSPLSAADYARAAKTLMSFGTASGEVLPILKMLGDVSMGNSERFGSLSLAFAQTTAAGRLMGQEVLQFVNSGFNPLQQISKRTGESMLQLKKRMEDGGVSAKEVAQAFRDATSEGGLFFNAIQRGAETMEGKIAQFQDTVLGLKLAFGEGLNEGLKDAFDAAGGQISQFEELLKGMGANLGDAISEGIAGDTAKLEEIGATLFAVILVGMKNAAKGSLAAIGETMIRGVKGGANLVDPYVLGPLTDKALGPNLSPMDIGRMTSQDAVSDIAPLLQGLATRPLEKDAFGQFGPTPTSQPDPVAMEVARAINEMNQSLKAVEEINRFLRQQADSLN